MTKLIYTGRRLSGTKLVYTYLPEDGRYTGGPHDPYLVFSRTLKAAAKIGAIIDSEETEPGRFKRDGKIEGYYEKSAVVVAEWEAHDRADANIYYRRQDEKKQNRKHKTPLEESVNRFRLAMSGMTRQQRAAFLAWLIEELR